MTNLTAKSGTAVSSPSPSSKEFAKGDLHSIKEEALESLEDSSSMNKSASRVQSHEVTSELLRENTKNTRPSALSSGDEDQMTELRKRTSKMYPIKKTVKRG